MLKLYKITPNKYNEFYYFKNFDSYLEALSDYLIAELDTSNYITEVDGILRAKGDFWNSSYCIDTTFEHPRCYFVDRVRFVSGYSELSVSHDLWGEYIDQLIVDHATLTRGYFLSDENKQNYIGLVDTNLTPYGEPSYLQYDIFDTNPYLFFNVEYSIAKTTISTNESLTTNRVFFTQFDLNNIYQAINDFANINAIILNGKNYDANVTGMWIVPKNKNEELPATNLVQFQTTYVKEDGELAQNIIMGRAPLGARFEKEMTLTLLFKDKATFFGTKSNYLPLHVNSLDKTAIRLVLTVNSNRISYEVFENDNSIDITNDLTIDTVTLNGTFNQQQKMAYALRNIFSSFSGLTNTFSGIFSGNVGQVALGAQQFTTTLTDVLERRRGKVNYKNVDGMSVWLDNAFNSTRLSETGELLCGNPFVVVQYNILESFDFAKIGYKMDKYLTINEWGTLLSNERLCFVSAIIAPRNLPTEVQDYFCEKFASGVVLNNPEGALAPVNG